MYQKIKSRFLSLSISIKIMISMLIIVLLLCLFLIILTNRYFTKLYLEDTYEKSNLAINVSEQALTYSYDTLLDNVSEFASTKIFQKTIGNILKRGITTDDRTALQDSIYNLVHSNPYIDSAMLVFKKGEIISHYTKTLRSEVSLKDTFGWDLHKVEGITFLQNSESPYTRGNDVVPVVFPIIQLYKEGYFFIANNYDEAELFIIILLNDYELEKILAFSSDDKTDSKLILVNNSDIINIRPGMPYYELAEDIMYQDGKIQTSNETTSNIYDGSEYMIFSKSLKFSQLHLVNIVSKDAVFMRIQSMKEYIILIAIIGMLLATVLSHVLSRFVTRPFNRLMHSIQQISDGEYDVPYQTLYNDEIGKLNTSLNLMHGTIQQQFLDIKEKEAAKFQAEINLLSEQVNPHFLYNTLECINMEVLCKHNSAASDMISNLSSFLRIGLNYGSNLILFADELKHAQAYLNIMNYRFNQTIGLKAMIEQNLEEWRVIKYILQPLIENAIKHGFGNDMLEVMGTVPAITVQAYRKENDVIIEVSDNGRGIDIDKAKAALKANEAEATKQNNHFGLYSMQQRLRHYYGIGVKIEFETTPYFKNSVIIRLPYIYSNLSLGNQNLKSQREDRNKK